MAKVEITRPGERIVEEFTSLVPQPTSPSTARAPDVGLVELSYVTPTELVPGPPGPPGPAGSRWYTGVGDPTIPNAKLGDMYLDDITGYIWTWNGTAWVMTGTDLSPDASELLLKLKTVDGAGSGLDADLLDGQDGAYYLDWDNFTDKPATYPPTLPIDYTTGISGKPSTFPPAAHGHPFTEITGVITDAQHGNRAGGALHPAATAATAGFFTDAASDGTQYVRKDGGWTAVSVPPGTYIGDTPPGSPTNGQLWWESDTGNFFIWYVDVAGPGQWVQINIAPANMPPPPPSDGGEYVMANGIWRLSKQVFKPVTATQNIPIPSTAKLAKINAELWLSAAAAGAMRWSIDGTTFPAGASDYTYSGQFMYAGSTVNAKGPANNAAYVPIHATHDLLSMPAHFQALLGVAKATATTASYFTMSSRGTAFANTATLYAQEYFLKSWNQAALSGATQLAAFQMLPTTGGFVAGTVIEVEWIY